MTGFEPPAYPYDRLSAARLKAESHHGGVVDLSVGTPCDPPPSVVLRALESSGAERGYPSSVGTTDFRDAASSWIARRFGVDVPAPSVAACVGTKEFVATLPQWLRLRHPDRDRVLYPSPSYPTYEMGAVLAGCLPVPVRSDSRGRLDLAGVADRDAERSLMLWLNSPGNPTGGLVDTASAAAWARDRSIPVFSDECYAEFTWHGSPRTVLQEGTEGLMAVHSLSKRSNMAGLRSGFYAGDPDLVGYLSEVRKHAGFMMAGPVQAASAAALRDDSHVALQRQRYQERLERFQEILKAIGMQAPSPRGGFYLWARAAGGGGEGLETEGSWGMVEYLATEAGVLVAPGEFFGEGGGGHVRVAMVQPIERLDLVARRLGCS